MAYSLIPIVAVIIGAIINWDVFMSKKYRVMNSDIFRAYKIVIICQFIFFTADILWGVLDSLSNKVPAMIDTTIFFVSMAFGVSAWLRFAAKYLEEKKLTSNITLVFALIFLIAGVTLVIINIFNPILFSYSSGEYVPKAGRYSYFTAQMAMYLIASIIAFVRTLTNKNYRKVRYLTIGLVGLIMAGLTVLQIFYPNLPLYSLGHLLSMVLIHMFIVNTESQSYQRSISAASQRVKEKSQELETTKELAYQDQLTGIRNKHAYVEREESIDASLHDKSSGNLCLFIFDLNDLKLINDTFGHEQGDEYIIKSVKIIKQVFKNQIIYRIGGDEFATFVDGPDFNNRYYLLEQFNKVVESNIGKNEPIIAVGFADYVPEKDNSLRSIFTRADERMYARKKVLKEMAAKENEGQKDSAVSDSVSRQEYYEIFYRHGKLSLINFLNSSPCDEIVEIDVVNDTYKIFYHVEGKYFVPNVDISYKELLEFTAKHIVHPDDAGEYLALMKIDGFFERLANAKIPNFDFAHFRYKLQDGAYRYVEQCVIAGEENGIPPGMFRIYIFDIHNMMIRRMGIASDDSNVISHVRDKTTGLLNSKDFFVKAEQIVKDNPKKQWCVLFLDIEHFKFFDEWYGREQGDYLLAKIGAELSESELVHNGAAGYFGQDDFVILAEFDKDKIKALYENIHHHIASFGLTAGFLPAIGVALLEKDMILVDAIDRASIAASKAKGDIRNRIIYYNSDMQFLAEHEYRVLSDFMSALQNDEITFYLQPQCRAKTGKIVGAEALARWIKKDGTQIPPAVFIPVLEKYNFITDLDQYIWEKVCKSLKHWLDSGHIAVPVSINVSRIDIYNFDIATYIRNLADKYEIPHRLIKVEITESAYAETVNIIEDIVSRLRKDGFEVLMDDFGSGYSSLNMLSTIKLDAIKLDSEFLRLEGADYERGIRIIESVVNMAKTMTLPIIVEGVETKKQCEFLMELGCRYIQGYYFYKPLSREDFEKVVKQKDMIDERGFVVKPNEQLRIREFLDKNIYSDSMLNNIIGAVAFYSWDKEHVDIVRYNQQFYQAVDVPDFAERLVNIELFAPEEDRPIMFAALQEAMDNRLSGSIATIRFHRSDGGLMSFRIHFYYLGQKEGRELFYGAAYNDSELANLKEVKDLITEYSTDNMILVSVINKKFRFNVISHTVSNLLGITPSELEKELNDSSFIKRCVNPKEMAEINKEALKLAGKHKEFNKIVTVYDKDNNKVKINVEFLCVADDADNVAYILKAQPIEK